MKQSLIAVLCGLVLVPTLFGQVKKHPFHKNVKVTFTAEHMIVESDGIPTHKTGVFPSRDNPNRILKQSYRFLIPRRPKIAAKPTPLPMGPIGVAINGIPFCNPYNRERKDAVTGQFAEVFDSCCGHPDEFGRYHYHKYPVCVKTPFKDPKGKHSPIIGYAFDGFPIYGPNDTDGKTPGDLDECNGHSDDVRGYHYHVTSKFPYILGAYKGVVETANFAKKGKRKLKKDGFPPPKKKGFPKHHHPLERALDANGDGTISANELKRASQLLRRLDANGDGVLSPREYRPKGPPPFPPPGRLPFPPKR